jgi:transposase
VKNRLVREYTYAFAAISPHDGVMDSLILPWVNAETMSLFLAIVAERHLDEFIVMALDGAGWHIAEDLVVPHNMKLVFLPPYSPELNPVEHLWDHLRENHFSNFLFSSMSVLTNELCRALHQTELIPTCNQ